MPPSLTSLHVGRCKILGDSDHRIISERKAITSSAVDNADVGESWFFPPAARATCPRQASCVRLVVGYSLRMTPMTTPWMSAFSTKIGSKASLAGWRRIRPFSL